MFNICNIQYKVKMMMTEKGKNMSTIKKMSYIIIFLVLIYFSPLKNAIFTRDFPKNFLINLFEEESKSIPPNLVTPITEKATSISGRNSSENATIEIFINQQKQSRYTLISDKYGNFNQPISNDSKLKPGDLIWVKQSKNGKKSGFSSPYRILDSTMISYFLEKDKKIINSMRNTINVLLSWSVLIVGGFAYLLFKERKQFQLILLIIPVLFLFILSIYFGFSCICSIIEAIEKGVLVSSYSSVHLCWWKQIQIFEQAIFLSVIFFLWNISFNKNIRKGGEQLEKVPNHYNIHNFICF